MKNILLISTLFLLSFTSKAIVIRHDVDDAKYKATIEDFPALATFYIDGAHGTLIHPKWVVTAAHATFCVTTDSLVNVNSLARKVKQTYIHPNYKPGHSHDIALIELTAPVKDVQPVEIYRTNDELSKQVWFIGIGGTGTGLTGETLDNAQNNGMLRKAQNTIIDAKGPLIKFTFNQANQALPLEGVSGGGDSGGPAYIIIDNAFQLLGISSRPEGQFKNIGEYGITEVYSRISYFESWLDDVIAGNKTAPSVLSQDKLPAGLTKEILPIVCNDIGIK